MSSTLGMPTTLAYVAAVAVLASLALTILNLLALYANTIATLRAAPAEIRDGLGALRNQLLEEREALRQQTRQLRVKKDQIRRDAAIAATAAVLSSSTRHHHGHPSSGRAPSSASHPAHRGRPRSSASRSVDNLLVQSNAHLRLTYSEQTLGLHYQAVRDLWRRFEALEQPFLVPLPDDAQAEQQQTTAAAAAAAAAARPPQDAWDKDYHHHHHHDGGHGGHGDDGDDVATVVMVHEKATGGRARQTGGHRHHPDDSEAPPDHAEQCLIAYRCDWTHRILWWQRKREVATLADAVQRVMLRRMEREVTCARTMLQQLRDGADFDLVALSSPRAPGTPLHHPASLVRRPLGETYNVYESSDDDDSASDSGTRMRRRLEGLGHHHHHKASVSGDPRYRDHHHTASPGSQPQRRPPGPQRNHSSDHQQQQLRRRPSQRQMRGLSVDPNASRSPPPPLSRPHTRHSSRSPTKTRYQHAYDASPRTRQSSFDGP